MSFKSIYVNNSNNIDVDDCIYLIESLPSSEPSEKNQEEGKYIDKINESLKILEKHLELISNENYVGAVVEGYNACSLMLELFLKKEGYEICNEAVIQNDEKIPLIGFCAQENIFPKECNEFLNSMEEYKNNYFELNNSYDVALSFLKGLSYFLVWFNNYYSNKYSIDEPFKIKDCYIAIDRLAYSQDNEVIFKPKSSETKKQKTEIEKNGPQINLSSNTIDSNLFFSEMKKFSEKLTSIQQTVEKGQDTIISTLNDIKKEIKNISLKITDYQSLIERQIKTFESDEEKDMLIAAFADVCAERIINETNSFTDDDSYDSEKTNIINLLGESAWNKLSEESKTCLISSKLMFDNLNYMDEILDYSGVCILVTKALEVELFKRFYKNFFEYLDKKYHRKYNNYPTGLLYKNRGRLNEDKFNLGTMAYIFCLKEHDNYYKAKNNEEKLIEYCASDLFNENETKEIKILIKKFGNEIENIREKYRNPSAHRNNISKDDAKDCLNIVLCGDDRLLKEMLDSFKK